jgi:hypothetical protein
MAVSASAARPRKVLRFEQDEERQVLQMFVDGVLDQEFPLAKCLATQERLNSRCLICRDGELEILLFRRNEGPRLVCSSCGQSFVVVDDELLNIQ